ncbi:MAG: hypothetical protein HYY04_16070 [Chloroflexi bacterium]|nr:hypothetical protein [Chloroflexota bacterium]
MAVEPIQNAVESYEAYLRLGLRDEDGVVDEILLVLNTRSAIEDRWSELSSLDKRRVTELDDLLVVKHDLIAEVLPFPQRPGSRHWWWYLDEGPQVREQARQKAG